MKVGFNTHINVILYLIFLILFPYITFSQTSTYFTPLFESQTENLVKKVFVENDKLICEINKSIISRFNLENNPFTFLKGIEDKSFALIKYYFGQKSERSNFELYLMDENFMISFYRKFDFYYEEPLPKIFILNSNEALFLYPSTGRIKLISKTRETEIDLLKDKDLNFFQERIGHLVPYDGKILITLSQLKRNDKFYSKIFLINIETLELVSFEIDLPIIHKIFIDELKIYLSIIETDPVFKTGFYILELNESILSEKRLIKISDEFIENKVKNSVDLFFGRDCFYLQSNKSLIKKEFCLNGELILDALLLENALVVLTRQNLNSHFYKLDKNFNIIEKEIIQGYLTSPEIKLSFDKKLYLLDRNKTILVKNFSEE